MAALFLAVLILGGLGFDACGQTAGLSPRWRWSNPLPHGGNVFDMAYGLGLTVQVAERGQLFTSEDLVYWEPRDSRTSNSLLAVTFLGNRLIAAGENGTVVYADSLDDFRVVDLKTSDWLMGAAASQNVAILVGDNAAIYTSSEGTNWTRRAPPAGFNQWLCSVVYGKNNFVAVGEEGSIVTSANGVSWKKQTSGVAVTLNRVGYFNDQFWAAGQNGVLLTSPNGADWTSVQNLGATNTWYAVAGNTNFQVVAGAGQVQGRKGNGPWSPHTGPARRNPAPAWTYYSAMSQSELILLAGRSGMMVEGVSTNSDELDWIMRYNSVRTWLWDIATANNFYVTVGDRATIMTSGDGVNWSLESVPDSATNSILLGVAGSENGLVAVGNKGTILWSPKNVANPPVEPDTMGVIWLAITNSPTTNDLQAAAASSNRFLVAGGNGVILTSANGIAWTAAGSGSSAFLSGAAFHPGGAVVTGDRGTILSSGDLRIWTPRPAGTTNWIFKVRFLNGGLIAVGQNGTILASQDGIQWQLRSSGTTKWLNDVAYVGGLYYVVGNQGTVLTSTDTVRWSNLGTLTQKSLFGAGTLQGQLVLTGVEGAIIRSQIVPRTEPISFLRFAATPPTNAVIRKLFLISGLPDQRFSLDSSTRIPSWISGPVLEMLDPSGTLLYLEEGPHKEQEYFRGKLSF